MANAFNDATCDNCGKRLSWTGDSKNRPACPKCGRRPPQEELDAVDKEMAKAEQEIMDKLANRERRC